MLVQVLELTPSTAGWYYAPAAAPVAVPRPPRAAPPPATILQLPDLPGTLGYGPDGRLRKATARPRVWLLA
jgi:hypothetical protein